MAGFDKSPSLIPEGQKPNPLYLLKSWAIGKRPMTGKVEGLTGLCKVLPKGVCNQILTCVNLYVPSRLHWCREGKYQQGDIS